MSYIEIRQRGTADFPIELYCLNSGADRYEMVPHWHSELEIIRIISGTLHIRLNNNTYEAKENDVLFINPEILHSAVPENCIYECLDFHIDFLSTCCEGCRYFFDGILSGEYVINEFLPYNSEEFSNLVNSLFESMKKKSSGYKFRVIGNLYNLFSYIIDSHLYVRSKALGAATDKNVPRLKKVISFIHENYENPIHLNEMAEAAQMSPKYFCYFFKEMTSKTPVEYLNGYRIEKAAKKLLNTNDSVTDIAYSCGFNDLSYFIKTFKIQKGMSPAKFRKNI